MKRIPLLSVASIEILNKKELKPINAYLKASFGVVLPENFAYLKSSKDNLYMAARGIENIPIKKLRISSIGLYIGEWHKGEFRLSIEGSQLLGPKATKGIVDISEEKMKQWMRGEPVNIECKEKGYVIVRHGNDYLGPGRIKDGVLLNYVPKTRRVKELA